MSVEPQKNTGPAVAALSAKPTQPAPGASKAPSEPAVHITRAKFSDGTFLDFGPEDIIVFVGPNNSGKSQTLRDIRGLVEGPSYFSVVAKEVALKLSGSAADVTAHISARGKRREKQGDFIYHINGEQVTSAHVLPFWKNAGEQGLHGLTAMFVHHLDVQSRLTAADTAPSFSRSTGHPSLPAHYVYLQPRREETIAIAFKQAFGKGIVFNRSGGNEIPILFGDRPAKQSGEEEHSEAFQTKLAALPLISQQGDGIRCFAGILLNVIAAPTSVLLIDEPEAFLHPPQARVIGKFLASNQRKGTQLFISTHSSDLLRGLLDANTGRVRVVRLVREDDVNHVKQLDNTNIEQFWRDPLLRFSNILDGLFHDKVAVTEADGDCRFFAAMADVTAITGPSAAREPDMLFTPTFGKDRLLVVVKALRAIGVPTLAVADFDFLRSSKKVEELYTAMGGNDWTNLKPLHSQLIQAVESNERSLDARLLVPFIEGLLKQNTGAVFADSDAVEIRKRLKLESPWDDMKRSGVSSLPGGAVFNACSQLLKGLEAVGLFIVKKGELESFDPSIGKHGPAWVADVLTKNLATDPTLADARMFVRELVDWKGT